MDWLTNHFKSIYSNSNKTGSGNSGPVNIDSNGASIYHEKQVKELCALHALNNVFQERFFTKATLDELCVELSPQEFINPHRSILGRGNYNVNIIMKAVQLKEHEAIWFDKRKPILTLNLNKIKGFIVNVPSDYKIGGFISLPWERKHWIAITKINNVYYNLDSKLEKPESIGVEEQLISYLENVIKSKDKEIILIVSKEVELDGSWRK